ncbi:hypothetical protein ACFVXG_17065 [Kitasatospora sp. NPDC058162]|uniref:hypothetical protein n=1 Tax=Kitasatospora sp. NPDC058162 TaxID=3346362 RepID=UPI0036DCC5D5
MEYVVIGALVIIGVLVIASVGVRKNGRRGGGLTPAELNSYAEELRRELYARSTVSGVWIDVTDHVRRQPFIPVRLFLKVVNSLARAGVVKGSPRINRAGVSIRLTDKAVEEARMERIMSASQQPRNVTNNYQAGVVQIGDHNQAREVTTHFGTDQSALLAQLVAALGAVARDPELQPQLRDAAGQAAENLQGADPGRIPAIIERIRGIMSVAASGFEAVGPIIDALGSVL